MKKTQTWTYIHGFEQENFWVTDYTLESIGRANNGDVPFEDIALVDQTSRESINWVFAKIYMNPKTEINNRCGSNPNPKTKTKTGDCGVWPLSCFWRRRLAWDEGASIEQGTEKKPEDGWFLGYEDWGGIKVGVFGFYRRDHQIDEVIIIMNFKFYGTLCFKSTERSSIYVGPIRPKE